MKLCISSSRSPFAWLVSIPLFALALPAGAAVLEEVVVTAQKREQDIQDVGIAITAFTGEQLAALGMSESTDVADMTAGVFVSASSAGQTRQFTIRGVTANDFSDLLEAPNAVYIDEGYVASAQGQVFASFDVDRVEILKGPQGTLFGRNATGGLVHYLSRKPTDEFEAYADMTYGSYNQVRVESAISGPLTDNFSARLSGTYNRHDDILDNKFPLGLPAGMTGSPSGASDFWDDDQWAVRGQGLLKISGESELLVSAYAAQQNPASGQYQGAGTTAVLNAAGGQVDAIDSSKDPQACQTISAETGACIAGATRPLVGGDYFGYIDPDGSGHDTSVDHVTDDFNRYQTQGVTAKLTSSFEYFDLTAVSHYTHNTKLQSLDVDAGPAPQLIVMNNSEHDTFTQEIRLDGELDSSRWVLGFYYLSIDADYNVGLGNSPNGVIIFGGPPVLEDDALTKMETDSYSLFGQLDIDLTDKLTFIAGLRTILEDKDYDYESVFYLNTDDRTVDDNGPPLAPFIPAFSDKTSDILWAGKLQFDYHYSDDLLLYMGMNRGIKAGSFNAPLLPPLAPDDFGYDEEILTSYEGGFKATLMDGTTRLNGSMYYYDYNDYQAFLFVGVSGAIFNADAVFKGVELELQSTPMEGLDILLSASYIDAEVQSLAVAPGVLRDVEPSFTPDTQFSGLVRYEWPTEFMNGKVALQMDTNYASSAFHNIRNFQAHKMDSYIIGNARLSWTSVDDTWSGQVFVNNLADAHNQITGFELATLCGCSEEAHGKPRWFGVRVQYNWQ